MELGASLSRLALALTPGLASRLSARVLRKFGSPDGVFRASLSQLESCHLPPQVAQSIPVERSGLNSSDVLATLFDLEMKGIIPQLPGKQFSKVLL
jgi:predicted Rossmann fold nucleotide-binding protein DprA/Smf involved in DNA uptake